MATPFYSIDWKYSHLLHIIKLSQLKNKTEIIKMWVCSQNSMIMSLKNTCDTTYSTTKYVWHARHIISKLLYAILCTQGLFAYMDVHAGVYCNYCFYTLMIHFASCSSVQCITYLYHRTLIRHEHNKLVECFYRNNC